MPKQFVSLNATTSTFVQALDRVADPDLFDIPIIITNAEFRFIVADQVRAEGRSARIVLEPVSRDSAAAIAAASAFAANIDPKSVLLVLAADHFIPDATAFRSACHIAAPVAAAGRIVTFGIRPTSPATSYGYIRAGAQLAGSKLLEVAAFMEKPRGDVASKYVMEGCLWNSGNFLFRADVMLQELERFEPQIKRAADAAVADGISDLDFFRLGADAFGHAERKSIDYAVMERTELTAVLPVDYTWSDVGNWNAVWQVSDRDNNGNRLSGPTEVLMTRNSLVQADDTLLTTVIGLENVIVVSTPDAVLVAHQHEAERVKELVAAMKFKGRREATVSRKTHRPWGFFQSTDSGTRYQVKRISVKPGAKLSLQKHFHRSEHWVVVRGTAEVTIGDKTQVIHENESTYIPMGKVHRLGNPGKIDLELIEVQVGSYLGEDDILRMEDVYQRGEKFL